MEYKKGGIAMKECRYIVILMIGMISIIFAGMPPDCQPAPGCFYPASAQDEDTSEDRALRDLIYDETAKFLKELDVRGGGGKGTGKIICEVAVQLMCFASGVESADNPAAQKMVGIPRKVWRKMLQQNPAVIRRLLAGIWAAIQRGAEEIGFDTPEIQSAFDDIRSRWRKGGKRGSGSRSGGNLGGLQNPPNRQRVSGVQIARVVGRGESPTPLRPIMKARPTSPGGQSTPTPQAPVFPGQEEITAPSPTQSSATTAQPFTSNQAQPPTGGQGGSPINICIFCTPQQAQAQSQSQSNPQGQQGTNTSTSNNSGGGCTCLTGNDAASSSSSAAVQVKTLLAKIDRFLTRTDQTPPDTLTLEDFRQGLAMLYNTADQDLKKIIDNDASIIQNLPQKLWINQSSCQGYKEDACVVEKIGNANTDVEKCPYIVLKNIRMCIAHQTSLGTLETALIDSIIGKVEKDLYNNLVDYHKAIKNLLSSCSFQIATYMKTVRDILKNLSCDSQVKQQQEKKLAAVEVLLRNSEKCMNGEIPNLYSLLKAALNKYKILYGFIPLKEVVSLPHRNCLYSSEDWNSAYTVSGVKFESHTVHTVADIFDNFFAIGKNKLTLDELKKSQQCVNQELLEADIASECGDLASLAPAICAAGGLRKYRNEQSLYLPAYPVPANSSGAFTEALNWCSYRGRYLPGDFDPATFLNVKNPILCFLHNVIFEGVDKNTHEGNLNKATADPQNKYLWLLFGNGCRTGIGLSSLCVQGVNQMYSCRDIGKEVGKLVGGSFVEGGNGCGESSCCLQNVISAHFKRKALTLPEILDVVFFTESKQGTTTYHSPLTGINGGPLWYFCYEPSPLNMRATIKMIYNFWRLLSANNPPQAVKNFIDALLLKPITDALGPPSQEIPTEKDKPINIIASSVAGDEVKQLYQVVFNIGETLLKEKEKIYPSVDTSGDSSQDFPLLKIGEDTITLKYNNKEKGNISAISLEVKSGNTPCVYNITNPQASLPPNCDNQKIVNYLQAFVLYYLIGAPYFFADPNLRPATVFPSGQQENVIERIYGTGRDLMYFPYRESLSWGLWRLPFLFAKEDNLATRQNFSQEPYGTWGKFLPTLYYLAAEYRSLVEDLNKIKLKSGASTIEFKSFKIVPKDNIYTLGDISNSSSCIQNLFFEDNKPAQPQNLDDSLKKEDTWIQSGQAGQPSSWKQEAPMICRNLYPSIKDDNEAKNVFNNCISILSRIMVFIALYNQVVKEEFKLELKVLDENKIVASYLLPLLGFFNYKEQGQGQGELRPIVAISPSSFLALLVKNPDQTFGNNMIIPQDKQNEFSNTLLPIVKYTFPFFSILNTIDPAKYTGSDKIKILLGGVSKDNLLNFTSKLQDLLKLGDLTSQELANSLIGFFKGIVERQQKIEVEIIDNKIAVKLNEVKDVKAEATFCSSVFPK
jgi:hypothetical protein